MSEPTTTEKIIRIVLTLTIVPAVGFAIRFVPFLLLPAMRGWDQNADTFVVILFVGGAGFALLWPPKNASHYRIRWHIGCALLLSSLGWGSYQALASTQMTVDNRWYYKKLGFALYFVTFFALGYTLALLGRFVLPSTVTTSTSPEPPQGADVSQALPEKNEAKKESKKKKGS
jgi:hypothetical protein